MTKLLVEAGHEVDIFIPVDRLPPDLAAEMDWNGCRLHLVLSRRSVLSRAANRLLRLSGLKHLAMRRYWLALAAAVGRAVERVHTRSPFDVVQSSDSYWIGVGIVARPGRLNVVRCSAPMELYVPFNGRSDREALVHLELEETSVQRAEFAFAPSRLTAGHYGRKLGRLVAVLPTPAYPEVAADGQVPPGTPSRYLLHFANELSARKGTDLVAPAMLLALAEAPDLVMVWVGRINEAERPLLLSQLGAAADRVVILPRLGKAELYALIRGAICSVLPSRIDNVPNTVLESLMLGTPVIGSTDSSIEELVEPGVTGTLVENGSVPALSAAMVAAWRGGLPAQASFHWHDTTLGRAFHPEAALRAYLAAIEAARAAQPKGTTT